jgi:glycosyltransferase involved in cell wall biosynthesis
MKRSEVQRTLQASSTRRPRVGIDLHVVDGIFQGSRTHCLELFSRVVAITPEVDFVLIVNDPVKLLSFNAKFSSPNVAILQIPKRIAPVRLLWQFPQIARDQRLSLLHLQYIAPPVPFCATAVTVHDILFESHQQFFEKPFVLRSRLLVPLSIRRSAIVFTVSEFSRRQICDTYSISPGIVHTIPNGVDRTRFFPGNAGQETVQQLGLEAGRYFLTVGRLEPRKNHATLLRAWAQLREPRPRLVIVGQRHFRYNDVFELIRTLRLDGCVTIFDQTPDADLPAIYRNARGFVYTSWAEGFGMPVLEAMASGLPVVTSANTALLEVSRDAALHVDPSDPKDISNAIDALEQPTGLREGLIQRGLERSRHFSWDEASQTVRRAYLQHFGLVSHSSQEESAARS